VLYKQNVDNELFELLYVFDMGDNHDKELSLTASYLKYLGTDKYSAAQLQQEFYKLGCSFNVTSAGERSYIVLTGLSQNMLPAVELFEHLLAKAKADTEVYEHLVGDILKSRTNAKLNQSANFSRLRTYGVYGALSPATNLLTEAQLKALNPQLLVDKIHSLTSYKHRIFYYGPLAPATLTTTLNAHHHTPAKLLPLPAEAKFVEQPNGNKAYFAHYDAKQIQLIMFSKLGSYNKSLVPVSALYNEYFGGSMNAIVFQELREARGLAYTAQAAYAQPQRLDRSTYMIALIGTQTDKMGEAVEVFKTILNDMPESQAAFDIAKTAITQRLRTERILKSNVLWTYDAAQKLKLDYDIRRDVFKVVPTLTLDDIRKFQQANVKNLSYTFCILGDDKTVDFTKMAGFGTIEKLTQEQIFGY
jgi:predicted Zn-dependent peptidase